MPAMIKLHLQTLSYKNTVLSGERDLRGMIDLAADLGFDGVDFEDRQFASTDDAYLESLRLHALRRGLGVTYIGVIGGFGSTQHKDDEGHFRHICNWIDVCSKMGVPVIRVLGGHTPEGQTDEQAWPWLREWFRRVTDYARARRVVVGLHNHNHGMFPATGPQVIRMLDEINDPYFSHIVDMGQYRGSPGASGGTKGKPDPKHDFYAYIGQTAPRAVAARAKIYRIRSGEEEWLDYRRILPALKEAKFNGPLSVVFEGWDDLDEREAVPSAAKFLRRLLHEFRM
jgi:sugar phosphate isomerase/epimerase